MEKCLHGLQPFDKEQAGEIVAGAAGEGGQLETKVTIQIYTNGIINKEKNSERKFYIL